MTDEETAALVWLLSDTINNDRYPLSPRIQTLRHVHVRYDAQPTQDHKASVTVRLTASCAAPSRPAGASSSSRAWKYAASRLKRNGGPEDRRRPESSS